MSIATLRPLLAAVQTNGDITDARFAADLLLCICLLQLREYYRWEQGLGFGDTLPRAALGDWLKRREAHWDRLADRPLLPGLKPACAAWHRGDGGQALRAAAGAGATHFALLASALVEIVEGADLGTRLAKRRDDPSAVCRD